MRLPPTQALSITALDASPALPEVAYHSGHRRPADERFFQGHTTQHTASARAKFSGNLSSSDTSIERTHRAGSPPSASARPTCPDLRPHAILSTSPPSSSRSPVSVARASSSNASMGVRSASSGSSSLPRGICASTQNGEAAIPTVGSSHAKAPPRGLEVRPRLRTHGKRRRLQRRRPAAMRAPVRDVVAIVPKRPPARAPYDELLHLLHSTLRCTGPGAG